IISILHHPRRQVMAIPAKDLSHIVTIVEAVHHPLRPLRPSVARIRAVSLEGRIASGFELLRRRAHQEPHLPVTRVISERHRFPVGRANAPLSAEDEKLLASELGGIPAHACILTQAKKIPARAFPEHLFSKRQAPLRPRR